MLSSPRSFSDYFWSGVGCEEDPPAPSRHTNGSRFMVNSCYFPLVKSQTKCAEGLMDKAAF